MRTILLSALALALAGFSLATTLAISSSAHADAYSNDCRGVQGASFPRRGKALTLSVHGVGTPTDGTVRVRVSQDWSGILCLTADHPLRAQAEREARAAFDTRQSLVIDVDDGEVTALARRPWITKAEPKTTPAAAGKPPAKPSAATTPAKAKAPPATP